MCDGGCGRSPSSWLPPAGKAWGRGGCAISAERPFLLSEQGRRKAGGDLASSQKGFWRTVWNRWEPFSSCLTPTLEKTGHEKGSLGSHRLGTPSPGVARE